MNEFSIDSLRRTGETLFGRDSVTFGLGARTYRGLKRVRKALPFAKLSPLENAKRVADIALESQTCKPGPSAKHILFLSVRGWPVHLALETLVAARLRQMGHRVSFLTCSDSLPFCMFLSSNHPEQAQRDCSKCCRAKDIVPTPSFPTAKLPRPDETPNPIGHLVQPLGIRECRTFTFEGVPYGELSYRSLVWFLRRSLLTETDAPLYRKALLSAHAVRCGIEREVAAGHLDTVVMLNGDFGPERVAGFVLKGLGVRYISHDYAFHEKLGVSVNSSIWDDLTHSAESRAYPPAVSDRERAQGKQLLRKWRTTGGYQGYLFWSKTDLRSQRNLREQLGLDDRPLAAAYTNLTFESSVVGKDRTFTDQFEWMSALVGWFSKHPTYQLAIRIHPAEVRADHWHPNESLFEFIKAKLAPLPENVHLIAPEAKLSSYALGELARVILVYSSTLGLEMAERGRHVITAAHVHYAGRGFTVDPDSAAVYFEALEERLAEESALPDEARRKLIDYFAWFLFRRLTPFEALSEIKEGWPNVTVKGLRALASPKLQGVQQFCRLIAEEKSWW